MCVWEGGGGRTDGRNGAALKTKTPHVNVGNKSLLVNKLEWDGRMACAILNSEGVVSASILCGVGYFFTDGI